MAAGLVLVAAMDLGGLGEGLAVGNHGGVVLHVQAEAALEAVQGALEMHLALAPEDALLGLGILFDLEGGVLLAEALQGQRELHIVTALGGVQAEGQHGLHGLGPGQFHLGIG